MTTSKRKSESTQGQSEMSGIVSRELAQWSVHTPGLLKEVSGNPGTAILRAPIQIFADILAEVATRASQINDPALNALMIRLTLYEIADPYSKDYDRDACQKVLATNTALTGASETMEEHHGN